MAGDPFYKTKVWKELRKAVLWRDGGVCVVEGCWAKAEIVDHIKARPRGAVGLGPADELSNLRSLCRKHDNQIKEKKNGERRNGGIFYHEKAGCDINGFPVGPDSFGWLESRD